MVIKRLVKRVGLGLGIGFSLLALFLLEENLRGQWMLHHYRTELIAAGEKLEPQELVKPAPAAELENGKRFVEAGTLLRKMQSNSRLVDLLVFPIAFSAEGRASLKDESKGPAVRELPPSRGEEAGDDEPWTAKNPPSWEDLELILKKVAGPLAAAKECLRHPMAMPGDPTQDTPIANGRALMSMMQWLQADFIWKRQQQDRAGVLDDLALEAALARGFGKLSDLMDQNMKSNTKAWLTEEGWLALQMGGWNEEQLAELQESISKDNDAYSGIWCMEMNRDQITRIYDLLRAANINRASILRMEGVSFSRILAEDDYDPPEPSETMLWLRGMLWRLGWSTQDQVRHLRSWQEVVETSRNLEQHRNWAALKIIKKPVPQWGWWHRLRYGLGDGLPGSSEVLKFMHLSVQWETWQETLLAALALERYHLQHGQYPALLSALVPAFLAELPHDWINGQPLHYQRRTDGSYLLYSVGDDGVDDGGNPLPVDPKKKPLFMDGHDFVWPQMTASK